MKRPKLDASPLPTVFPIPGTITVTCSPGQWDTFLQAAYNRGALLLEIEERHGREIAVRAWKKSTPTPDGGRDKERPITR